MNPHKFPIVCFKASTLILQSFPSPFICLAVLPVFVRHNVSMPILIVSHVEDEGSNLQISGLIYVAQDGHG